jgi:hypothetical protein
VTGLYTVFFQRRDSVLASHGIIAAAPRGSVTQLEFVRELRLVRFRASHPLSLTIDHSYMARPTADPQCIYQPLRWRATANPVRFGQVCRVCRGMRCLLVCRVKSPRIWPASDPVLVCVFAARLRRIKPMPRYGHCAAWHTIVRCRTPCIGRAIQSAGRRSNSSCAA